MKREILKKVNFYILFILFLRLAIPVSVVCLSLTGGKFPDTSNYTSIVLLDLLLGIIISVIVVCGYKDLIVESIKKIKCEKFTNFIRKVIIGFVILLIIKYLSAYFIDLIERIFGLPTTTVENQTTLEKLIENNYILMMISACIFAPFNEELIFRGALKKVFKNKRVFITVSGLIFGLIHITGSITFLTEILIIGVIIDYICHKYKNKKVLLSVVSTVIIMIIFLGIYFLIYGNLLNVFNKIKITEVLGSIQYIALGFYLAYLYAREDNILLNISVHGLNNLLSMIAMLFL